jgi:hypothetical protein
MRYARQERRYGPVHHAEYEFPGRAAAAARRPGRDRPTVDDSGFFVILVYLVLTVASNAIFCSIEDQIRARVLIRRRR